MTAVLSPTLRLLTPDDATSPQYSWVGETLKARSKTNMWLDNSNSTSASFPVNHAIGAVLSSRLTMSSEFMMFGCSDGGSTAFTLNRSDSTSALRHTVLTAKFIRAKNKVRIIKPTSDEVRAVVYIIVQDLNASLNQ